MTPATTPDAALVTADLTDPTDPPLDPPPACELLPPPPELDPLEDETEGVEAEGVDAEGVDAEGVDADGVEAECVEPAGVETDGTVTDGTVTEGGVTEGTVTEGTVTEGVETEGLDTDGAETEGVLTGPRARAAVWAWALGSALSAKAPVAVASTVATVTARRSPSGCPDDSGARAPSRTVRHSLPAICSL